jgi:hypothetical protein
MGAMMSTSEYPAFVYVERALGVLTAAQCLFTPAAAATALMADKPTAQSLVLLQCFGLIYLYMHVGFHGWVQLATTSQQRKDNAACGALLWGGAVAFNLSLLNTGFSTPLNKYMNIGSGVFFTACYAHRYITMPNGDAKKA